MPDKNKHKEVCELLKIWFYIDSTGLCWQEAKTALEERINIILDKDIPKPTPVPETDFSDDDIPF